MVGQEGNSATSKVSDDEILSRPQIPHIENEDQLAELPTLGSNPPSVGFSGGRAPYSLLSGMNKQSSASSRYFSAKPSLSFSGSFFSAKSTTPVLNFNSGSSAAYGTSYLSTSPFADALRNDPHFTNNLLAPDKAAKPSSSEYAELLKSRGLVPSIDTEFNWADRKPGSGQHVEFELHEKIPLEVHGLIGQSLMAKVEKVQCRRILLARKTMHCSRRLTLPEALNEVEHLQRLRHAHIIQLVGSYLQGKTFAILLYPVADFHLYDFLHETEKILLRSSTLSYGDFLIIASVGNFFRCLSAALEYIHNHSTKHMDIKPQNILVKAHQSHLFGYHVYVADFGVSHAFSPLDDSQTDSVVARTPKYCAPEVYNYEMRGRAADIFSLGCVFLEMQTVLCRQTRDDFEDLRAGDNGDTSFHRNLDCVYKWCASLHDHRPVFILAVEDILRHGVFAKYKLDMGGLVKDSVIVRHRGLCALIRVMLDKNPRARPSAALITKQLDTNPCCNTSSESFKAELPTQSKLVDESHHLTHLLDTGYNTFSVVERNLFLAHVLETGDADFVTKLFVHCTKFKVQLTDVEYPRGRTLVDIAVANGDFQIVRILLPQVHGSLSDILRELITDNNIAGLQKLLQEFPTIKDTAKQDMPPLIQAAAMRHLEVVKLLLHHNFNPNVLGLFVARRDLIMLKLLLDSGANICTKEDLKATIRAVENITFMAGDITPHQDGKPEALSEQPHSALAAAVLLPKDTTDPSAFEILEILLGSRSVDDVKVRKTIDEEGLLPTAVKLHDIRVAKLLLSRGANPNVKELSRPGRTALHYAASLTYDISSCHYKEFARRLIEMGAQADVCDQEHMIPLDLLSHYDPEWKIMLGAQPDMCDRENMRSLGFPCCKGPAETKCKHGRICGEGRRHL